MSMIAKNRAAYAAIDATRGMTVAHVDGRWYGRITTGSGRATVGYMTTPAGARAIAALDPADRAATLAASDAIRRDAGHPVNADRPTPTAVWDHHVVAATGGDVTPDAVRAWRTAHGTGPASRT